MNRVLVLYAHPAPHKSRVNRQLARAVRGLEGVTFHDLYEAYPDFDVDVKREQKLLLEHDIIVFQHPFYWYSTPSLVKEWIDLVLEYGWAYGDRRALEGKVWTHAVTAGGHEDAYQPAGSHNFTVREFMAPLEQTAILCGFRYVQPFVVHGALRLDPENEIPKAAARYRELIIRLRDQGTSGG